MVDLPDEVKNMEIRQPEAPREERPRSAYRGGERSGERSGGDRGERGGDRGDRGGDRGDRGDREGGGDRFGRGGGGPRKRRRLFWSGKVCNCCIKKLKYVDYKEIDILRRFVASEGKILPRRLSGACAHHQRMLTTAIKRARNIGLLPFSAR